MGGLDVRRRRRRARIAPWKHDKNNFQFRVGIAYQLNEKTVLRGGYGRYFLNPTGQGSNARLQPADAAHRVERRRPHADLQAGNPFPKGVQQPPGQLAGPADVPRARALASPTRTSWSRTSTSSRSASSASCRGSVVAGGELRRQPQLRHASGFSGFNEPSAAFQAQCDVTQGGSRSFCDAAAAEPVLQVAGLRGHDAFHQPDAVALRAEPAVPGVHRHHREPSATTAR